jgi:hypothetical protein
MALLRHRSFRPKRYRSFDLKWMGRGESCSQWSRSAGSPLILCFGAIWASLRHGLNGALCACRSLVPGTDAAGQGASFTEASRERPQGRIFRRKAEQEMKRASNADN